MAITVTEGPLTSTAVTAAAATAGYGQAPDRRKLYGPFGDNLTTLKPQQSPLYVFSSKVRKVPTSDQIFRSLEDRVATLSYDRTFLIANTPNTAAGTVVANGSYAFSVDKGGASVNWLIKGMVFIVRTVDDSGDLGYSQCTVRITTDPVDDGSTTSFTGKVVDLSETTPSGYNAIADNDEARVIGTAFKENTGPPDVWSEDVEDIFGYTQIFKTAAEVGNSTRATEYRGYKDEWARVWGHKLIEHRAAIESALLFGQRARDNDGVLYTKGIVGDIIKNTTLQLTDTTDLSYTAGQYYGRSIALASLTYDLFLRDAEVLFDVVRGGSANKLVLTSQQVMTRFHRIADGAGFLPNANVNGEFRLMLSDFFNNKTGVFGVNVMRINTPYGNFHLVLEPMFRAGQDRFMAFVDLQHVAYRPLVGNGMSRDTFIEPNIQAPGQDGRKDQIVTEAGFEVTMPELHMLYHLEDN